MKFGRIAKIKCHNAIEFIALVNFTTRAKKSRFDFALFLGTKTKKERGKNLW